ncbi:uncharacterized protein Z520_09686 [Fonsecaea multimorphosa CBS 102226]|uniref:Major facilitator superfamily (MFS) profile domain-containing protein n=1 Tax=Fonsecaea multimorphosa CBS 102226 TaxID=1442371 RepID=A0A0D2GYL5_9EURO|nr:uncharacterized protein Z520_09686 [Fonsecaea multimorphosa CBS 102226]KIX94640.1 hypothetical protein Z520_09686 [Fonsecaea multimorphosa CBS 102226]
MGQILGRKWNIFWGCNIVLIGAAIQASSYSVAQLIVGRIVAGLGVGIISTMVPMWIAECSHVNRRGVAIVLNCSLVIVGIVIASFSNYGLVFSWPSHEGQDIVWRTALALQMIFPLFVYVMLPFCPESPRWLAAKGASVSTVASVLSLLDGKDVPETAPHIVTKAEEIVAVAQHEAELGTSWAQVFGGGELQNGRRLFLSGFVVGLLQQVTGVNAIVYYAPVVFQDAGLNPKNSFILGGAGSVAMLIGTALPALWVEKAGRRKTLLISAALEAFTMAGIAASIGWGINHPEDRTSAGWAATAFILAFEFCFGLGVYAPEVNSLRSRHRGNAVQTMGLWGGGFLIVMVSPPGVANLSWKYYLIWVVITLVWIPMVWAFCPETAGRSLEEMDYFFKKYQNKWYIRDVAHERMSQEDVMSVHEETKGIEEQIEVSEKHATALL